ncbi:MAG: polysaccharide deacetylase family protein [Paracoccaceae bacterium]|jgi:peptidoglycan/xylan/chitin deacetylase (PgdA/CDA1 family)|nr:polysaccharide deacetylase family protein [Paracoccaceae bacterium]
MSGRHRPLPPLNGKRLLVHVALNVEHWPFDQPMPRTVLPPPHGKGQGPDVPNFSWVEYGLRAGMPRILDMMGERGLIGGALLNASVVETYPACAEALLEAGWEFVGHGYTQRALSFEDDEAEVIGRSLEILRRFSGQRVRAWLGPGLAETEHTPDILMAHGVDCVHEWVLDDVPCWLRTKHGPMIALPYSVELNDVPVYAIEHGPSAALYDRVVDTLAQFEGELTVQPKVLTLALHPHLIGVPHRAVHLARILDLLMARDDTIFVTSSTMADWFAAASRPDGA